ncbi:hypothetical protein MA16_Dca001825 [Dendrobium catenatum]|uniref:Uncharacterized protein n=1 Tax=Dendrobium catenatum TaxID=906689 RepID=A0A2I0XDM3_9ASPA|nr:hypothetical protein MA16_Dca001825 [Dendrobium catenatum]
MEAAMKQTRELEEAKSGGFDEIKTRNKEIGKLNEQVQQLKTKNVKKLKELKAAEANTTVLRKQSEGLESLDGRDDNVVCPSLESSYLCELRWWRFKDAQFAFPPLGVCMIMYVQVSIAQGYLASHENQAGGPTGSTGLVLDFPWARGAFATNLVLCRLDISAVSSKVVMLFWVYYSSFSWNCCSSILTVVSSLQHDGLFHAWMYPFWKILNRYPKEKVFKVEDRRVLCLARMVKNIPYSLPHQEGEKISGSLPHEEGGKEPREKKEEKEESFNRLAPPRPPPECCSTTAVGMLHHNGTTKGRRSATAPPSDH